MNLIQHSICFVAILLLPAFAEPQQEPADTVAINGKIYTCNPDQKWAEAIAFKGKNIVYVGDNAGAEAFVGDRTRIGDLKGRLVLPGLVSGHEHPMVTAAIRTALNIDYSEDKEKMLAAVAKYIKEQPDAPRFSWGGSYEGRIDLYREEIDKITTEPFVMVAASGHGAWINSAALEAIGVTKDKKAPVDGFERGPDGTPNGYLSTSAATCHALVSLNLMTKEAVAEKLPEVVQMYNGYGLTAVHDVGVPVGTEPSIWAAAADLEKQGKLNLRISAAAIAQRTIHLEGAFKILKE